MNLSLFLCVVAGVLVSFILPPLSVYVRGYFQKPGTAANLGGWGTAADALKPYAALALFSTISALMVMAALHGKLDDPYQAVIAGYAWDSTLQKLVKP
jgi:hypothetical protein